MAAASSYIRLLLAGWQMADGGWQRAEGRSALRHLPSAIGVGLERVDIERLHAAANGHAAQRFEFGEGTMRAAQRLRADQRRDSFFFRHRLEARGDVDRVADDGELETRAAAEAAGDNAAGVNADADADRHVARLIQLGNAGEDRLDGIERALRVIARRIGRAEDG